ncbi:hypothetical protein ACFLQR_01370, partial [Verrucomicrobiota bacterium]
IFCSRTGEAEDGVREARGRYRINVATDSAVEIHEVEGLELFNPAGRQDRHALVDAVSRADEIATALPSVEFYGSGEPGSVTDILAEGFKLRIGRDDTRRSIVYTAENNNRAAEILEEKVAGCLGDLAPRARDRVQYLDTVIGKMSGIVTDEAQIKEQCLARMTGNKGRCFLVEVFNRILISRVRWPDFPRGITVFEEKDDLLPFEEAKLYGHNAVHALAGYLARKKGYSVMADVRKDASLFALARDAFIEESGRALCRRHHDVDPLFTEHGYLAYADDLLQRMTNPYLRDTVERVVRDPRRKLGWDDRLVGTMCVALSEGIIPRRFALGAGAALGLLADLEGGDEKSILDQIWSDSSAPEQEKQKIKRLIFQSEKG